MCSDIVNNDRMVEYAATGQIELVQSLIKTKCNVNVRDQNGITPALAAAKRNDLPMLSLLSDNGADLSASDDIGETVLMWANINHNQEMIKLVTGKKSY